MDIPQPPRSSSLPAAQRRARSPLARLGFGLLRRLQWRLGVRVLGLYSAPIQPPVPVPTAFTVRSLDEAQAIALGGERDLDIRPEWARAAIRRGDRCLAAYEGARVVGYTWVSRRQVLLDEGLDVRLGSDQEYRFKTFVRPGARGRGVTPLLYRTADRLALADGCQQAFLCIAPDNESSIRAARKSGAERVGFTVVWTFGGRARTWFSPGARSSGLARRR